MDLARARALAKDHLAATREAMVLAEEDGSGEWLYRIAGVFSLSSAAADSDEKLPVQEREKLTDEYATQAVQRLREACESGYFDNELSIKCLETDPDLDPIRSREDFQLLLKESTREPEDAAARDSAESSVRQLAENKIPSPIGKMGSLSISSSHQPRDAKRRRLRLVPNGSESS